MKVEIEYCGVCNYRPIAANLSMALHRELGIKAELVHSNDPGSFEVITDGELIFSKKTSGRFPESAEIIDIVKTKRDDTEKR
jgi:selT/selW/selH-like putative selenoprotein